MWRLGVFFITFFIAIWKATQHVAASLKYDPLLGSPLMIDKGVPFLGICLGLQLLFDSSEESPGVKGLSVLWTLEIYCLVFPSKTACS